MAGGFQKNLFHLPLSCLLLALALSCVPLLNAQVVLQDNFTYKTPNIDGHATTTGPGLWESNSSESSISTDGTQALISLGNGKVGEGQITANCRFSLNPNTIYTLKVTFKIKSLNSEGKDVWMAMGFSNPEGGESDDPWVLIRPARTDADEGVMVALHKRGEEPFGEVRIPAADFTVPLVASIKWNSSTGKTQYFLNGTLQDYEGKTTLPTGDRNIFFQGWQCGNLISVTNVTLTAEPIKAKTK